DVDKFFAHLLRDRLVSLMVVLAKEIDVFIRIPMVPRMGKNTAIDEPLADQLESGKAAVAGDDEAVRRDCQRIAPVLLDRRGKLVNVGVIVGVPVDLGVLRAWLKRRNSLADGRVRR